MTVSEAHQLIICANGDVIPGHEGSLRQHLGRFAAQGDIVAYALRNLGYVQVEHGRASRIRFRPSVVHEIAFAQAVAWLADTPSERVIVSWLEDDWRDELFGTKEAAIGRIVELSSPYRVDTSRFRSKEARIDAVDMIPLARLVRAWTALGGVYDRERLAGLFEKVLDRRYLVAKERENSRWLSIAEVGAGLVLYNVDWRVRLEGLRVDDMPDYAYGRWVAEGMRQAQRRGAPIHTEVDAMVRSSGGGLKRTRYRRVVLPFKDRNGHSVLVSASLFDDRIDLGTGKRSHVG